ncbi:MAG: cysteine-rich CWC family protein [Oceanospirillales bacterium]|nr:cysteine-rich CWC family protein [Oceanospirillales bacterium]
MQLQFFWSNLLNRNTIDPLVCPLCRQENACVNLSSQDVDQSCWCNDPSIQFPEALLAQIPDALRRKACVCRSCAVEFQKRQLQT